MKRILIGIAVVLGWLGACHTPSVDWPKMVKCEASAVVSNAENIAAAVSRILLTGGAAWQSDLEGLAKTYGADAVACAIEALKRDWSAPGYGATDARIPVGIQRAGEFLSERGVQVQ